MGQVNTVNARAQFSEIINRAAFGKERVTLTRRGRLSPSYRSKTYNCWKP
jgi:antitoxin (DNA-binding transcriptional repressor) of toxin-antitoxin stability system